MRRELRSADGGPLRRRAARRVLDRLAVVHEPAEVALRQPQAAQLVERLHVRECLGEEHAVDAARGRAREDVHHEARAHVAVQLRVELRAQRIGAAHAPAQFAVHGVERREPELGNQRGARRAAQRLGRRRRAHEVQQLLRDAVDVDGERNAAVEHDGEPHLAVGVDEPRVGERDRLGLATADPPSGWVRARASRARGVGPRVFAGRRRTWDYGGADDCIAPGRGPAESFSVRLPADRAERTHAAGGSPASRFRGFPLRPEPRGPAPCPPGTGRPHARGGGPRCDRRGRERARRLRQPAQHRLQDAAVAVVVHVHRRVEARDRLELEHRAVLALRAHRHLHGAARAGRSGRGCRTSRGR